MTKVRRVTVSEGTARGLARHEAGYSASGEGQWSRKVASGPAGPKFSGSPSRIRGAGIDRTLAGQIEFERARMRKLQIDIDLETNPTRRAKLERDEDIKANFLARLIAEQQGEAP
jgi:hypothetical protein